ncbi:MAG: redoxin domain-containing protein [Candidatus Nitrosotenuis sp.]|uniref:Alkyl hydroperoxide reductase/ Thiol specific antioxidant/ Mal allergen n=1 Tax=Candidatus Nitrosotenuis uzonensis TaxID=1407055 RepID=V6ATS5_9ARCH|nr:redoxin domain-containing protein [Candidatus Nitrosotenuis uzonensis]CDI05984.1 Alkyl hydroperoxide reductase/ Thiol specific antioxidant/ Mal allergen [Candidatus Nitrosotenuis uzonensis]
MMAQIGQKAPNLGVSKWVQGMPTNIDQEKDKIVVVEVFQVNCPGCFLYGIPEAINIYNKYKDQGVRVLGIATAFEDFDKNTVENLELLAKTGEVIGETKKALTQYGKIVDGNKLPYKIPFPLGMDNLVKESGAPSQEKMLAFIKSQIPEFDDQPETYRKEILARVEQYFKSKEYSAETFDKYALRGTPSAIVVDRKGILRDVSFGQMGHLEPLVQQLLNE